jgi:hypothetical protein
LERLVREKHSSLLGPFVSDGESKVLYLLHECGFFRFSFYFIMKGAFAVSNLLLLVSLTLLVYQYMVMACQAFVIWTGDGDREERMKEKNMKF